LHNPLTQADQTPFDVLTEAGKVIAMRAWATRLAGGTVVLYDEQQNNIAEMRMGSPAFEPVQKGELRAHPIAPEEGANADAVPIMGAVMTPEGTPIFRLPVHTSPGKLGIALSQSSVELGGQVRLDALVVRW